jgi:AAA+ superfamily predicted ATPase
MRPPPEICGDNGPYAESGVHLRDELARADLLVRAQVARWRLTIGASKPPNLWGMIHVSDAEIDHYIGADLVTPDELPEPVYDVVRHFWAAAERARERIQRRIGAKGSTRDLRVERLRSGFGLSAAEMDVLLFCLLAEVDFRYRRIFGYLQDDASRACPAADLLGQMAHPDVPTLEQKEAVFNSCGKLRRWRLIRIASEAESRCVRAVRIEERVAAFLLGRDETDSRLEPVLRQLPPGEAWDRLYVASATVNALRDFAAHAPVPAIAVLHGLPGSGRESAARAMCASRGMGVLRFDADAALHSGIPTDELIPLAYREAILRNSALFVDSLDRPRQEERQPRFASDLIHVAETAPTLTFLAADTAGESLQPARLLRYVRFDFPPPRYELRRAIWLAWLPPLKGAPDPATAAAKLAAAFQLDEGQIRGAIAAAGALARRRSFAHPEPTLADYYEASRRQAGRRLLGFARRIEPTSGLKLDDVILTEANRRQLRELLDRIRLRSRDEHEAMLGVALGRSKGLLALFAGPSGTGKTLAAEIIAAQQGLDLYKIDASMVVSKWLGETEKNLGRVFADAEGSDALLFFDECDSLFGQRGEISEARDRWANLQTNYLLQRIEEYSGTVILATNLRQNIDDAFLRRIHVVVEFPAPDAPLRLEMWRRSIAPAASALTEADLRQIADRFTLSGGSIRNVAVDAAYRALAADRTRIELRDVVDSVAREYQKIGRPITQGEFGEQFYGWALADVIAPRKPG